MGGFASAVFDQTMADPQVRNRLIRAMMGSDPSATMNPPQNDRIADDTTRHPAGFEEEAPHGAAAAPGSTEDLEARGTAGRLSLAAQMQQNANQPPSHLDQMQQQYDAMQPPQPKKMSLLKALAIGIPTAGVGIPVAMRNAQLNQQFEEGRFDRNRQSLLAEIEAERRGQMQEQGASDRMISQQEMENQRQREMDQRQANLFGQQSGLERQRESLRQQMQQDTEAQRQSSQQAQFDQQDKRQNATFAEQEKLADKRAAAAQGKGDTSTREKVLTYWQPSLDSAERVNVMSKNYEDATQKHDQQAMLSLLANHLGMTMGLQKGARLNQAIIDEAQKSQPWLQGLKAKFDSDGYLSGVTLSPQQMKQMLDLGFERYREDVKKSRSMSGYVGVTDEPARQLSRESAGYYVQQAGGDKERARALAKQDGWTF